MTASHGQDPRQSATMQVIPVAGRDSMLMTLSRGPRARFHGNLVILTDSTGHRGIRGDHGRGLHRALVPLTPLVEGEPVARARLRRIMGKIHGSAGLFVCP